MAIDAKNNPPTLTQNGYKMTWLKKKGQNARISVQHKATNTAKTIQFQPRVQGSKLFDWDPIIEGAATALDLIAPELAPFVHAGKGFLKHLTKHGHKKKEKKEKKHEDNFEKAFEGKMKERNLGPITSQLHATPSLNLSFANSVHHSIVNGVSVPTHVQAHDGKMIAVHDYAAWRKTRERPIHSEHGLIQPLQNRLTFKSATCQANLRDIINAKVDPTDVVIPSVNGRTIELSARNTARINPISRLSDKAVPILNGEMGTEMDMTPVTITKTEDHAVIAGSELLGDLIIPPGGGVSGGVPITQFINPRMFSGTKLTIEAQTWLMYRFRKFIIEYIPTVGANTTGNFLEYFAQDPYELTKTGLDQRRNAMVHDEAVPFQPFTYVVAGMTPKKADKSLYYMDAENGEDERLVFQSRYVVTNNALNADSTTVPSYGSLVIHYECDFYYPALPTGGSSGFYPVRQFSSNTISSTAQIILLSIPLTDISDVTVGSLYTGVFLAGPTNFLQTKFPKPGGDVPLAVGNTYFLSCFGVNTTTNQSLWYMFDQLNYALTPLSNIDYTLHSVAASITGGTVSMGNVLRVDPVLFQLPQAQAVLDDSSSSSDEEEQLTASERDLLEIKRKIGTVSVSQLPSIRALRGQTPK